MKGESSMSRIDNLKLSYQQAQNKKLAIEANSQQLRIKRANIDKQLQANEKKIEKLNFFLEKTEQTLQG